MASVETVRREAIGPIRRYLYVMRALGFMFPLYFSSKEKMLPEICQCRLCERSDYTGIK